MGRKSKAESRRPEILDATYQTLMEESLETASLAKIARRAGIAPSLITHYFNTKEELIFALTDYLMDKYDEFLMQDFSQISDKNERLEKIISTRLREFTCSVVDEKIWFNLFSLALREMKIKEKIHDLYKKDQEALAEQLYSCASKNLKREELYCLAGIITVSMEGLGYYAALSEGRTALVNETSRLERILISEARSVLGL